MEARSSYVKGYASLLLLTLLWGSTFPFIKIAVVEVGYAHYVALRHVAAALALTPIAVKAWRQLRGTWRPGAVLGALYFAGITLQGWGMEFTTASNAAFITSLSVVMVYLIEAARGRAVFKLSLASSVVLSVVGVYLLSFSVGRLEPRLGDLIVLAGAFFWALQVIAVDAYTTRHSLLSLLFLEVAFTAVGGLALIVSAPHPSAESLSRAMAPLLYLALVCTLATNALQLYGQRYVISVGAAVTYTLEPVFAALLSSLLLSEYMQPMQVAGAALIVLAVALSARGLNL